MASKKLFLISKSNSVLSKLLQVLEIRLPKSAMTYNITKAFLDNRLTPEGAVSKIEFYSSNEQMDQNKSLIVIIQTRKFTKPLVVSISIPEDPLDLDQDTMKSFENTIDWTQPLLFSAVDCKFTKLIKNFPAIKNGKTEFDENFFYTMSLEDARQLNVPNLDEKNIQIKELNPEIDASTVSHYWKFTSGQRTVNQMQDAIKNMGSMGLYLNSKLISWILLSHIGSLNALHTLEEFRRKGYAELTLKAISKHCSEKGLIPNTQVQMPNISSKLLMDKAGYTYSHQVEWIDYEP